MNNKIAAGIAAGLVVLVGCSAAVVHSSSSSHTPPTIAGNAAAPSTGSLEQLWATSAPAARASSSTAPDEFPSRAATLAPAGATASSLPTATAVASTPAPTQTHRGHTGAAARPGSAPSGPPVKIAPATQPPSHPQQAAAVAVAFTRAWGHVHDMTQPAWLATIKPLAATSLEQLLAYTDINGRPDRTPVGKPAVQFTAVDSTLLEITLSDRSKVLVTVGRVGAGPWLVSDIEPDTGDR